MDVPTTPRPLKIVQISDPHLFAQRGQRLLNVDTDASLKGVVQHVLKHEEHVDAILATGDIAQDGSAGAYLRFLELVQPLAPVLRGLPGNHDSNDAFYSAWDERAQPVTDLGRWRLILLDSSIDGSSAGHIAQSQLDLLQHAIDTAGDHHVLVAVHHNPVPVGSRWLDSMMIANGHKLLGMLQGFTSVRGLIWGHVHQEFDSVYSASISPADDAGDHTDPAQDESGASQNRASANGKPGSGPHLLRLLAAPATCVQFTPRSPTFSLDTADPGYRRMELHDDGRIETEVVRVPGLGIAPDTDSKGY